MVPWIVSALTHPIVIVSALTHPIVVRSRVSSNTAHSAVAAAAASAAAEAAVGRSCVPLLGALSPRPGARAVVVVIARAAAA